MGYWTFILILWIVLSIFGVIIAKIIERLDVIEHDFDDDAN